MLLHLLLLRYITNVVRRKTFDIAKLLAKKETQIRGCELLLRVAYALEQSQMPARKFLIIRNLLQQAPLLLLENEDADLRALLEEILEVENRFKSQINVLRAVVDTALPHQRQSNIKGTPWNLGSRDTTGSRKMIKESITMLVETVTNAMSTLRNRIMTKVAMMYVQAKSIPKRYSQDTFTKNIVKSMRRNRMNQVTLRYLLLISNHPQLHYLLPHLRSA